MQHHPHGGESDQSATLLQVTKQHLRAQKTKMKGIGVRRERKQLWKGREKKNIDSEWSMFEIWIIPRPLPTILNWATYSDIFLMASTYKMIKSINGFSHTGKAHLQKHEHIYNNLLRPTNLAMLRSKRWTGCSPALLETRSQWNLSVGYHCYGLPPVVHQRTEWIYSMGRTSVNIFLLIADSNTKN